MRCSCACLRAWIAPFLFTAFGLALSLVIWPQGSGRTQEVKPYESGIRWEEPKMVQTGAPGTPPSDAVILFDGTNMKAWNGAEKWPIKDGAATATSWATTKQSFGNYQLHVEFATPKKVSGSGQGRGNNGIGLSNARYEVQVLDAWHNPTYWDGMCAAIYKQRPPLVNAARPPGEWQTYDIVFETPLFRDGKLTRPGYVTVFWDGAVVQNHVQLLGDTPYDRPPAYRPHPEKQPLALMYHNNPVRFRNIWIREIHELTGERTQ